MRLSLFRSFSSTVINLAKRSERKTIKGKADLVLVRCDSVVSGHRFVCFSTSRDSSNNSNFAEKATCNQSYGRNPQQLNRTFIRIGLRIPSAVIKTLFLLCNLQLSKEKQISYSQKVIGRCICSKGFVGTLR